MDDELVNFISERKARVAEDKACLEQDPPYMEIKAKPYRAYGSTVKENIPPKSVAQGKEESCSVGLPLGEEYERKKQRLQHELRMDYRRYVAQQHLLEDRAGAPHKQQSALQRDEATLTEDRGLQRALRLCPEEDKGRLSILPRHHERLGTAVDQESEEEYFKHKLDLMGKTHRHKGVEDNYEKRQSTRIDGREKRENPVCIARERGRLRGLTKNEVAEFATGLIIGAANTDEALQRRKSRYRQELQEQIAEQHQNKKSEAYRSPYEEPHHLYAARNLLDPNMAYYGHLPVPGAGLPMSYWNVPPGRTMSNQFGHCSPHSQRSFPDYSIQPSNETATVDSQVQVFPAERSRSTRERTLSYREALKQQEASRRGSSELHNQILERQERRRLEREESERYEVQLEADMKNHQPWGRGGGGAPLRDSTGNLIADLNQMHKLNEEAYSNSGQLRRRTATATMACRVEHPDPNERVSGFTHVQTSQFARGKVFGNQPTEQQVQEQDKYKAYLKQQIEEKMLKKEEERERTRLEDEKEEKRLAEQRAHIQREYEEEQEKKKRKEIEQKAKNEELIQLAQRRKKEVDEKKKEAEKQENAALRRQYERETQARVEEVCREPSPPIPTLQKKHGLHRYSSRPPTVDSQHSTAPISERSLSGFQSPPVPACRNHLRAAGDQRDVFSELSALRRQLRSVQKCLEGHLQQGEWEELDSPLSNRHRERPMVDVFDMARLRLQAPVRRTTSRNMEPRDVLQIYDSIQLKDNEADGEPRLGSSEDRKLEETGVPSRRRRDYGDPYHQFSNQTSTVQDDYFDLSPPGQNYHLRSLTRRSARGSLLESESAFIDHPGDAYPVPHTPELEKTHHLSARERRRLAKQSQYPQERADSSQPIGHHDNYSTHTDNRLQHEAEPGDEWRSQNRIGHALTVSRRGNTAVFSSQSKPSELFNNCRHRSVDVRVDNIGPWFGAFHF
ncbi:centrosome and spindle pole associated protein 1-like isoform X5 [Embiotoca jacksoni]|uniref:centrosome and spindle pole associated protein 1-like isoform X5 n=1 Tax=Embiotoca jacksoni TaxID=100190 RepID=UPI003703A8C6